MEKKAAKTTVKTVVKTDKAASPGGWYSQAYKVGNLIYTAGITANDPETQEMCTASGKAGKVLCGEAQDTGGEPGKQAGMQPRKGHCGHGQLLLYRQPGNL